MSQLNVDTNTAYKVRFLLTGKCTAVCDYCHNEGQSKAARQLSFEAIKTFINQAERNQHLPYEVVLSGGEPTLHKQVAAIAEFLQSKGIYVSMDSHVGHSKLLLPVLPHLDELKIHVDSFAAKEQFDSMEIKLSAVLKSIKLAKEYPDLKLIINHPVIDKQKSLSFIAQTRALGVDCKIIELFDQQHEVPLNSFDFKAMGYSVENQSTYTHRLTGHHLYIKRCGHQHNPDNTLFIGYEGVRDAVDSNIVTPLDQTLLDVKVIPIIPL